MLPNGGEAGLSKSRVIFGGRWEIKGPNILKSIGKNPKILKRVFIPGGGIRAGDIGISEVVI